MSRAIRNLPELVPYMAARGLAAELKIPLFDSDHDELRNFWEKVDGEASVLYLVTTESAQAKYIAAFTSVHNGQKNSWRADGTAFVAVRQANGGVHIAPSSHANAIYIAPNGLCQWGACSFVADVSKGCTQGSVAANAAFAVPGVGAIKIKRIQAYKVSRKGAIQYAVSPLPVFAKLAPFLQFCPHFTEDQLDECTLLCASESVPTKVVFSSSTLPHDLRSGLLRAGITVLTVPGHERPTSEGIVEVVKQTSVRCLRVEGGVSSDQQKFAEAVAAAFNQGDNKLGCFALDATAQNLQVLTMVLKENPPQLRQLTLNLDHSGMTCEALFEILDHCTETHVEVVKLEGNGLAATTTKDIQRLTEFQKRYPKIKLDGGHNSVLEEHCVPEEAGVMAISLERQSKPKAGAKGMISLFQLIRMTECPKEKLAKFSRTYEQFAKDAGEEHSFPVELERTVQQQALDVAGAFISSCATDDDHNLAITEGSFSLFMPPHHVDFFDMHIGIKFTHPRALLMFLGEVLEVAVFLDVPSLRRFVQSRILMLLATTPFDDFIA